MMTSALQHTETERWRKGISLLALASIWLRRQCGMTITTKRKIGNRYGWEDNRPWSTYSGRGERLQKEENETRRWESEIRLSFQSRLTVVCGATQGWHRRESPFGPRWPGAQNRPARHDSIGRADGGG